MSAVQPLTLYGHNGGPNPWKVAIILEELSVPYVFKNLDVPSMKKEPYLSLNPNGRVPAVEDPNTGLTIFESGAIIDYLCEKYDKEGKLAAKGGEQGKWTARGFRDFQMSGQGPYTGQKIWFMKFHSEKVQSAIDRYANEVKRVVGVIELHLSKVKTPYLTGDSASYADLMFVPWFRALPVTLPEGTDLAAEFPLFKSWWDSLLARDAVKKALADSEKLHAQNQK